LRLGPIRDSSVAAGNSFFRLIDYNLKVRPIVIFSPTLKWPPLQASDFAEVSGEDTYIPPRWSAFGNPLRQVGSVHVAVRLRVAGARHGPAGGVYQAPPKKRIAAGRAEIVG
jgi:hypothetical protein